MVLFLIFVQRTIRPFHFLKINLLKKSLSKSKVNLRDPISSMPFELSHFSILKNQLLHLRNFKELF